MDYWVKVENMNIENNMNDVKVSVIMPVYNTGEYLKTAVESILSQSLKEFELILVDDGSTDGSSERCDDYARLDSRVVVLHQKNGGICNARNAALKIARGEYIAFSDHDDEYLPGLLEENYIKCVADNLDFVKFCKLWVTIDNGKVIEEGGNKIESRMYERKDVVPNIVRLTENRLGSCVWDAMFRRQFLLDNDIWFNPFFTMGGEDYEFVYKCMSFVNRFATVDKAYYKHVIRNNFSTSSKFNPKCMEVQRHQPENMVNLLKAHGFKPSDIKDEYAFFYTMFYLSPQTQNIMKTFKGTAERVAQMTALRTETYWYDFIDTANFSWKRNKIYFIIHYLFKFKCYRTMFLMYSLFKR